MVKSYFNQDVLSGKISFFQKYGAERLHILSDFDRTFTKPHINGKPVPSVISILRDEEGYLDKDYKEKAKALFNKYHPIEVNPEIPLNEKKKAMQEWWRAHFDLLIKSGLNLRDIGKVVLFPNLQFREGYLEFLSMLHKANIPLVIISSAGLGGDSIRLLLKREYALYDNIHIVSNEYQWDKNGNAISVKEPIIHVFNKNESSLKNFPFYEDIKHRKNVLLLGDSLGDLDMVAGFDYDTLISVGFLDEEVQKNLKTYRENFDVVIVNEGDFSYVNRIVKEIIKA